METISTDFQKPIYQPYPKAKKNELHKYIKKKKKKRAVTTNHYFDLNVNSQICKKEQVNSMNRM